MSTDLLPLLKHFANMICKSLNEQLIIPCNQQKKGYARVFRIFISDEYDNASITGRNVMFLI